MSLIKSQKSFQHYIDGLAEIESDRKALAEFLRLHGRFFKLGLAEIIGISSQNKNAEMLADYDVWLKFGRQVQRGEKGIAVMAGNKTRHLFDISQTFGDSRPRQWGVNKDLSVKVVEAFNQSGRAFGSFTKCIESLTRENVSKRLDSFFSEINISLPRERFKALINSINSISMQIVAARCEYNGSYRYKGNVDFSAFDIISRNAQNEHIHFLSVLQIASHAAKETLLSVEKTINKINMLERNENHGKLENDEKQRTEAPERQRTPNRERTGVQMGRTGREVAPDTLYRRQGNPVSVRPRNDDLSATTDLHNRTVRTGNADRTRGEIRESVAEAHGGEPQRGSGATQNQLPIGNSGATSGRGSVEDLRASPGAIQQSESVPKHEQLHGYEQVQRNDGLLHQPRNNEGHSATTQDSINTQTPAAYDIGGGFLLSDLNNQLSLWGEEDKEIAAINPDEQIIKAALIRGSNIRDSKFRIEKFAKTNAQAEIFAEFLKDEYGWGGSSGDDIIASFDYNSKGIHIRLRENGRVITLNWNDTAKRITELINNGEYITDKDISERIRHAQYVVNSYEPPREDDTGYNPSRDNSKIEYERAKEVLALYKIDMVDEKQDLSQVILENYHITDTNLGAGSQRQKYNRNVAAIRLLKTLEAESREATTEEKDVLAWYVGWGGIPEAFDRRAAGGDSPDWSNEYTELKELLTEDEYRKARASVLNAHYTSPEVIEAMYYALESFGVTNKSKILEPACGVGNFFGLLPKSIQGAELYGIELDSITGRIAKKLYPAAEIQITGFENTEFPDNFFDVAVGNVPFGNYGVHDNRYNKENFLIHDYFFAKTLDKVAPGGIIAFITSKGTLDKQNSKVREYIAERADLIGAIRLPNNAFKRNANTEVTTDIIFLQKRETPPTQLPNWCYTVPIGTHEKDPKQEQQIINSHFKDNPHMVLGVLKIITSRYGYDTACVAKENVTLKELLKDAVSQLSAVLKSRRTEVENQARQGIIHAKAEVRNFTHGIVNGALYYRNGDKMTLVTASKSLYERMLSLHNMRIQMRLVIDAQTNNCSDSELTALQDELNIKYDTFIEKYGNINSTENRRAFGEDDDFNLLCSLEIPDSENKDYIKADIFTQRTVRPKVELSSADTIDEAYQISLDIKGKIDIEYISGLLADTPPSEVISTLVNRDMIYRNPLTAKENEPFSGYEEASEYLSGNIHEKLTAAVLFAESNPEYERNVKALENSLPPLIEAHDISVKLGASWIEVADYESFLMRLAGKNWDSEKLRRTPLGEYKIDGKGFDIGNAVTVQYGTSRLSLYYIFENLLNQRDITVKDKKTDNDEREYYEVNVKETQLAREKARLIKEEFPKWLWNNPERREKYVEKYNRLFNCLVGRKYDGSHQTFSGMNSNIELEPHQKDAIARAKYGGNTLLAHCVGAGKSFEMFASVMEKKRLGIINKACVVVPKALVGQTAAEWLRLYPNARIFAAGERDFQKDNRQKFAARCLTGNYDGIIMSYEQFGKIPMSLEYREEFINDELEQINNMIDEADDDRATVKDLQRKQKLLETRLKKLIDWSEDSKDKALNFEQFGFDYLVVDEAHNYKNGLVVSRMSNVSGVSTTPAQKSEDILMKCNWLNDKYGCKNILYATGTPVSNSMTELYIMKNYLRPDLLQKAGLYTFDDWAANFGEVVSQLEIKPAGNGFRTKKRFSKFVNLPDLISIYKEFADVQTAEMLKLPVPELKGGKPQIIVAKPSEFQKDYMKILAQRSEAVHNGSVDPKDDNMLKITHEARLLGLDERTISSCTGNNPNGKVNLCIEKVMEIYERTKEQKGVQAIFCDIAVNSDNGRFSVYENIKETLIECGIPRDEICFANNAKNVKQRNELFAKIRSGHIRIVIASTSKMGTGANIQNKLCALHHLDIPWRPSDLMQRNGRIIRQGNENDQVEIFNYVTENTFDAYMLNIITTKQKFISQLFNGDSSVRTCEDVDDMVLTYSEMQALATGDPRIKERIELNNKISELRNLESAHNASIYKMQDDMKRLPCQIEDYKESMTKAKNDKETVSKNAKGEFEIEIGGRIYHERREAEILILKELIRLSVMNADRKDKSVLGSFCGMEFGVKAGSVLGETRYHLYVSGKLSYECEAGTSDGSRNIVRLENLVSGEINNRVLKYVARIESLTNDLKVAGENLYAPFERADELRAALIRMAELDEIFSKPDDIISENADTEEQEAEPERELNQEIKKNNGNKKPKI